MESKITFEKDEYISNDRIEKILLQIDTFHRFILINSQTVVGNPLRSFNRRTSKIIDVGDGTKLILNISLQKKINSDLEISYILKSSNGIALVTSCQEYITYDDIYKDLIYIINCIKKLYDEVKSEINMTYTDETTIPVEKSAEEIEVE